jgi:4-hydroxy-2-oxoheptanedioate aldolase
MQEILKSFKQKISKGKPVYGLFMKSCDPSFVEVAAYSGFDFAILDMEHGWMTYETLQNNIRAAYLQGMLSVVRIGDLSENAVGMAYDIGACGVQVPKVEDAEQCIYAVKYAKFHPLGERGVCRFVRAAGYSAVERSEYFKNSNNNILVAQIEGRGALANIDSILDVDGIDIIFIGPYDLSQALGVPGQVNHPLVVDNMKCVVKKARDKGKVVGTFIDNIENLKLWKSAEVQYLAYSVDVGIFYEACKNILKECRST